MMARESGVTTRWTCTPGFRILPLIFLQTCVFNKNFFIGSRKSESEAIRPRINGEADLTPCFSNKVNGIVIATEKYASSVVKGVFMDFN